MKPRAAFALATAALAWAVALVPAALVAPAYTGTARSSSGVPVTRRAPGRTPRQPGVVPGGQADQPRAPLARLGRAYEEPAEQADREDHALDHHDRAGDRLVLEWADAVLRLAAGVPRVEDRAREDH